MIEAILAARYARAIGAIAAEQQMLDRVVQELELLADITSPGAGSISVPELLTFLRAPRIPLADKVRVTDVMLEKLRFSKAVGDLLNILIKRRRIGIIGLIARRVRRIVDQHKGVVTAEAETARELSEAERREIAAAIEAALGIKAELRCRVAPELIGGLRARVGDRLVDGSVAGSLRTLEKRIRR